MAIGKYLDHAPLERQARVMSREGLTIESQTLWDQIDALAQVLQLTWARLPRLIALANMPGGM